MHFLFKGVIIVFGLALATCAPTTPCPSATPEQAKKSQVALTNFAVNLLKNVTSKDENKNQVVSPVSIALALALLESGANGKTRDELKNVLLEQSASREDVLTVYRAVEEQLKQVNNNDKTQLTIANAVFHADDLKLKQEYVNSLQCLNTETRPADFKNQLEQTRQKINEYVSQKTSQKITELFKKSSLTNQDRLVLANAVSFKASWKQSFDKAATKQDVFYRNGQEQDKQTVPFMQQSASLRHLASNEQDTLELPYDQKDLAMYVMLPKSRDGVRDLEKKMTGAAFRDIVSRLQQKQVNVQLPKFAVRASVDLKATLTKMGLQTVFGDSADLSRMSEVLSKVNSGVHEAQITVDENGTVGAAATAVSVQTRTVSEFAVEAETSFKADHPFLYAVVHKPTGAIVFLGKVNSIEKDA